MDDHRSVHELKVPKNSLWRYVRADRVLPPPTVRVGRRRKYDEAGFSELARRFAVLSERGEIRKRSRPVRDEAMGLFHQLAQLIDYWATIPASQIADLYGGDELRNRLSGLAFAFLTKVDDGTVPKAVQAYTGEATRRTTCGRSTNGRAGGNSRRRTKKRNRRWVPAVSSTERQTTPEEFNVRHKLYSPTAGK